ncbi:hypothetical protein AN478_06665 [Thiohalorhabdus denitrificans]|uniref:Uncharacterized protein n=1 Tax=Thiohalorhabdus denitrificans TaxID=381306 RepID=A0A0P9C6K8_9GAMM|nr:hypothetical protein [Thiohalorhabdus denitrificans]KPV40467.1 hypothetical protein AN478_06665 [Thiohalorhabdus denitrificans]SCY61607.1 hypothetical protein SAMN05661077_2696 [Thiohalorhabdus denitrificans]
MRIANQDREQVQIAVHPEEASLLLSELKSHAELMDGEADDLIEALEQAGVQPYDYPQHYRLEFPQNWHKVRRASPEEVTLTRQEVVGM